MRSLLGWVRVLLLTRSSVVIYLCHSLSLALLVTGMCSLLLWNLLVASFFLSGVLLWVRGLGVRVVVDTAGCTCPSLRPAFAACGGGAGSSSCGSVRERARASLACGGPYCMARAAVGIVPL